MDTYCIFDTSTDAIIERGLSLEQAAKRLLTADNMMIDIVEEDGRFYLLRGRQASRLYTLLVGRTEDEIYQDVVDAENAWAGLEAHREYLEAA